MKDGNGNMEIWKYGDTYVHCMYMCGTYISATFSTAVCLSCMYTHWAHRSQDVNL